MVDLDEGITILPELAAIDMTAKQLQHIRKFKSPVPVREVSLAVHRNFVKRRLVEVLKQQILASIPGKIRMNKKDLIVPV
jgi:LysR family hydrogen peroxide-inducible transcriptional activator